MTVQSESQYFWPHKIRYGCAINDINIVNVVVIRLYDFLLVAINRIVDWYWLAAVTAGYRL